MPLPEQKLYQYESFSDYVNDYHFWNLFEPNSYYDCNESRIILHRDNNKVVHIGDIRLSGTVPSTTPKSAIEKALRSEFEGIFIQSRHVSLQDYAWTVRKEATHAWKYANTQTWLGRQVPFNIVTSRGIVTVRYIDFNINTILKTEVPKSLVRIKFGRLNPERWLSNLGVCKAKGEFNYKRVGLNSFHIPRGVSGTWRNYICWDVPNDVRLLQNDKIIHNFDQSPCTVHLPYVSLPFTPGLEANIAMAFNADDFLPNPRQRRELFHLVKKMDKIGLQAYFSNKKTIWNMLGPIDGRKWSGSAINKSRLQSWENRYVKLKAVTSHQPNSVLGQILLEENIAVIKFTLQYFSICAMAINQLKIGTCHAVEMLARAGRLALVNSLIVGTLKLSGKVHFRPQSFKRVWSAAFAAIEVNNINSLLTAVALDKRGTLLRIRGEQGITALGLAVINNRVELVAVLLEASANVNQPSWGDETPLGLALNFQVSSEIIKNLIKTGANVNGHDLTGNSLRDKLKSREIFVV